MLGVNLASAGPEAHVSISAARMKICSISGPPGFTISLTSLRVTPVGSVSMLVAEMTPSNLCSNFVEMVMVVP